MVEIDCKSGILKILVHFIRKICAKFGISNSTRHPDIEQNSDTCISNFLTSDQSFRNKNCHKSRTNHDISMKHGPVTKLDKKNTVTSKKIDDVFTFGNWDVLKKLKTELKTSYRALILYY